MAQAERHNIREEVFHLDFDLKAETFISYLEEETDLDIALDDFFKRRFGNDITEIKGTIDDKDPLKVVLSRRGFYNIFPERFFHTTYSSTSFVPTMVADYQNRLLEEERARKFFKPLESEFFLQKVAIEKSEDETFKSLGSPELVSFLIDLWQLDASIPKRMAAKILKTMPFMYKIAGNLPLLKTILEHIVEERIAITSDFSALGEPNDIEPMRLGVNMATSGPPKTFLPKYLFTLVDIKHPDHIEAYLPNGTIISAVRFFLKHTLPFECDFEIDFTVAKSKRKFIMDDAVYSGRLGLSATI
ncbi:hypothetical protein [Maribacter sp. 2-571]|uniref:hypothetical protein n=1 Tax=Maribacter sp. 2-571 TaxID=3417569 RepID=UPI003D32C32E